ncbi:MAG: CRISPR-associated endonuclease Cas2 [Thermoplasmatales archaeon]|nr:CRISPR-associated endonuclease Cas2 [Thermoplasmatales archaeon]
MYAIIVYDVGVERVSKICSFLRCFLSWVQNSVFEGELTESQLMRIKEGIKEIIDKNNDSVRIYIMRSKDVFKMELIGIEKADTGPFI